MTYKASVEDNIIIFKFDSNKYNSISTETLKGLDEAVQRLNNEKDLKGLILTGQGRIFTSGFELGIFLSFKDPEEAINWWKYQDMVMYNLFTCKKPVIAAVNGHATAAGMIVSMASDYRIVINNPKIKMGMTEITIGSPMGSCHAEIMKLGLGNDKNFRDFIFTGKLMSPNELIQRGIFDELATDETELLEKAKAKVCSLIDTPGQPFILFKYFEKRHAAEYILENHEKFDWNSLAAFYFDKSVVASFKKVQASMS